MNSQLNVTHDGAESGRVAIIGISGRLDASTIGQLERVLASAHGVAHAVVVPMTITATLQRLRAFIEPRPGATIDLAELARIARAHLSPHEVPRDFEIVATLPRTPSGKLLRGALMERAAAVP